MMMNQMMMILMRNKKTVRMIQVIVRKNKANQSLKSQRKVLMVRKPGKVIKASKNKRNNESDYFEKINICNSIKQNQHLPIFLCGTDKSE